MRIQYEDRADTLAAQVVPPPPGAHLHAVCVRFEGDEHWHHLVFADTYDEALRAADVFTLGVRFAESDAGMEFAIQEVGTVRDAEVLPAINELHTDEIHSTKRAMR